jgi:hypothetical protein
MKAGEWKTFDAYTRLILMDIGFGVAREQPCHEKTGWVFA